MDSQDYKETITEEYDGQSITLTGSIDDLSFYVTVGVWGHSNMISIGFQIPQ